MCTAIPSDGVPMLRATLVLFAFLFACLMILGEDRGQTRPGLAQGPAASAEVATEAGQPVAQDTPQPVAVVAAPVRAAEQTVDVAPPAAQRVIEAAFSPDPAPAAALPRAPTPRPVFTLSEVPAPAPVPDPARVPAPAAEAAAGGEVWYVTANAVNVRASPSTSAEVVGRLTRGEAALVIWHEGEDWARIVIEGDGIEGYVAARFLSATAP
jgi:uncharacterized protein YgiM (DUF1202 family)